MIGGNSKFKLGDRKFESKRKRGLKVIEGGDDVYIDLACWVIIIFNIIGILGGFFLIGYIITLYYKRITGNKTPDNKYRKSELRADLLELTPRELINRAKAMGIKMEKINAAGYAKDMKSSLIDLILAHEISVPGYSLGGTILSVICILFIIFIQIMIIYIFYTTCSSETSLEFREWVYFDFIIDFLYMIGEIIDGLADGK